MRKILSIILILLSFLSYSNAQEKQMIGVLAAAIGQVFNQDGIQLKTGDKIFFGDTIKVNEKSNSQILLLDQTVLNVGAKSEVIIDEFVFDPSNNDGKILSQIKQGSMKVITGLISEKNPDNLVVKVPAGSIGTRGTEFQAIVNNNNLESKILLIGPGPENTLGLRPGAVEVANNLGSVVLDQPYTYTKMIPNTPPDPPVVIPATELNEFKQSLEAKNTEVIQEPEQAAQDDETTRETLYADKSKDEVLGDVLKDDDVILALSREETETKTDENLENNQARSDNESQISSVINNDGEIVRSQNVINELSDLVSKRELDVQKFFALVGKDTKGNELRSLVKSDVSTRSALVSRIINNSVNNNDKSNAEKSDINSREIVSNDRNQINEITNIISEPVNAVASRSTSTSTSTNVYKYDSGSVRMTTTDGVEIFLTGSYRSIVNVDFDKKTISSNYTGNFTPASGLVKEFDVSNSTSYSSQPTQAFNFTLDSDGNNDTRSVLKSAVSSLTDDNLTGTSTDFSVGSSTVMAEYNSNDNSKFAGFGSFSTNSIAGVGSSSLTIEQSAVAKGSDLETFESGVKTLTGSKTSIVPTKQ